MTDLLQIFKKAARRNISLLFVLFLLYFSITILQSCSPLEEIEVPDVQVGKKPDGEKPDGDDPGNTDPGNTNPGDQQPTEKLSVDKAGGTIFKGDIKLVIPAEAFATTVNMEIEKQNSNAIMDEFEASTYYKIKLPLNFTKPLKIVLPAKSGVPDGDLFFRISSPGEALSALAENETSIWMIAEKEDELYTATLDPIEETSNEIAELIVGLVKDYEVIDHPSTKSSFATKKCKVIAPLKYREVGEEIAKYVEESINILESLGFSFEQRKNTIDVELINMKNPARYGEFVNSRFSREWNCLKINTQKLEDYYLNLMDQNEVKRTVIHEMTHFVQFYYDPRWTVTKSFLGGNFLWMDEAVAVWAEQFMADGISSVQQGAQFCPIEGFNGKEGEGASHGYGMAALVKWLADRYGNDKIVELHKKQLGGASSIKDAFDEVFPELFLEYILFEQDYIHKNGVQDLLASISRSVLNILSLEKTQTTSGNECEPYSMFMEKISINSNFELPKDNLYLSIEVEGGTNYGTKGQLCELYRVNPSTKKVTFISEFYDSYIFEEIKDLQETKEQLIVVYFHPFNKKTVMNITAQLKEKEMEFKTGKIKLQINDLKDYSGFFTASFPDELVVPINDATGTTSLSGDKVIYTSNETYSKKESYDKVESKWKIRIEIDSNTRKILNGSAENITSRYNDRAGDPDRGKLKRAQTTSFDFKEIPFTQVYSSDGSYHFGASESKGSIGSYLSNFSYRNSSWVEDYDGLVWTTKTVNSWNPNTKWSIAISLYP